MGHITVAASLAATKSSGSPITLIVILVLIFGIFYFLMIRPQRNRQRQAASMQDSVVPGQRVRTTAGMYGTITAVEDGDVVVEVAPGVEVRMLKRAIMDVLSDAPVDASMDGMDGMDGTGNGAQPAADAQVDPAQEEPSTTHSADGTDAARDGQAAEK